MATENNEQTRIHTPSLRNREKVFRCSRHSFRTNDEREEMLGNIYFEPRAPSRVLLTTLLHISSRTLKDSGRSLDSDKDFYYPKRKRMVRPKGLTVSMGPMKKRRTRRLDIVYLIPRSTPYTIRRTVAFTSSSRVCWTNPTL